jgi:hypothetical protein
MSATTVEAKTFNNQLGFERGLLMHQTTTFGRVPKRSVFGTTSDEDQHLTGFSLHISSDEVWLTHPN